MWFRFFSPFSPSSALSPSLPFPSFCAHECVRACVSAYLERRGRTQNKHPGKQPFVTVSANLRSKVTTLGDTLTTPFVPYHIGSCHHNTIPYIKTWHSDLKTVFFFFLLFRFVHVTCGQSWLLSYYLKKKSFKQLLKNWLHFYMAVEGSVLKREGRRDTNL